MAQSEIMLSAYAQSLQGEVKDRYLHKIKVLHDTDPYLLDIKHLSTDIELFPKVHYFDVMNYLKCAKSPYTDQELRAIKSTNAYAAYNSGWVRALGVQTYDEYVIVMGKVLHSQRLNETPLTPWLICQQDGFVISAHCTCVAGTGECCTHVGAVLFAVEDTIRNYEPVSVTGQKAYWMPPSKKIGVDTALKTMRFDVKHDEAESSLISISVVKEPTVTEQNKFLDGLKQLQDGTCKSAILHIHAPFCYEIAEKSNEEKNHYLTSLFDNCFLGISLIELQTIAQTIDVTVSSEDCLNIELATRSDRRKWFRYRSGRITASVFKRVCRTKMERPSLSLIKQICYPEKHTFSTPATRYGCSHEKDALHAYQNHMKQQHTEFKLQQCGFIINKDYVYFGATPDSLISCKCHGEGCVEVKCPICVKDINVDEIRQIKNFCLKTGDGNMCLDTKHTYFYQIQMQMAICKKNYCDFVVWSKANIFVERIAFDHDFWEKARVVANEFHRNVILPELLGKVFTGPHSASTKTAAETQYSSSIDEDVLWCLCQQQDTGTSMLCCDNSKCQILWYHMDCLQLTEFPDFPWYCTLCSSME